MKTETFKKLFKNLTEANIDSLFIEWNRQMVLRISSGDSHPKPGESLSEITENMHNARKDISEDSSSEFYAVENFLKSNIKEDSSFRYYSIQLNGYDVLIDYFVVLDEVDSDNKFAASTIINPYYTEDDKPFTFATILIREKHSAVTDDTFGMILKHELTHVIWEYLNVTTNILTESLDDPDITNDDLDSFEEFLCDYIQCEATASPNEDPVEKFTGIMKRYLTWIANDVYAPYLDLVSEYYREKQSEENDSTVTVEEDM